MTDNMEFDQNCILDSAEIISGPEISSFSNQERKNDFNFKGKKNKVDVRGNLLPISGLVLFVIIMLSFVVYTNTRTHVPAKGSSASGFVDSTDASSDPAEAESGDNVDTPPVPQMGEENHQAGQTQERKTDFPAEKKDPVAPVNDVSHVAAEVANHQQNNNDSALLVLTSRLDKAEEKISVVSTQWASIEVMSTEVAQLKSDMSEIKALVKQMQENGSRIQNKKKNKSTIPVSATTKNVTQKNEQPKIAKEQPMTKPSKLELTAVVQDQAWLINDKGETISVNVANPIVKGYGKVVRFDSENFRICFDSGKCIGD